MKLTSNYTSKSSLVVKTNSLQVKMQHAPLMKQNSLELTVVLFFMFSESGETILAVM